MINFIKNKGQLRAPRNTPILFLGGGRGWFILALFITCCFPAYTVLSQPIEDHFTHYIAKDGLAEGEITAITQDSTGFLWLASQNGLCRFDGHTFKTYRYNQADTNSTRENLIVGLFIDSKKRLWVTTPHWLHLYHPEGEWFEHFQAPGILWVNSFEDSGRLVISANNYLYNFDMQQKKFSPFLRDGMIIKQVVSYTKDEDGIEWFATVPGLVRYDPKTKKNFIVDSTHSWRNKKESNSVFQIILLPDGYLLATFSEDGLLLVNRKTCAFKEFHTKLLNPLAPLPKVNPTTPSYKRSGQIYKLNDSIILCSNSGGISVFNWRRETVTLLLPDKSDPASLLESDICVSRFFCDREGIIWLASQYLEKYDFKDYNIKVFPASGKKQKPKQFVSFYSLHRCPDGKFLLGGYDGMNIYDPAADVLVNNTSGKNNSTKYPYGKILYFNEGAGGKIWCYAQQNIYTQHNLEQQRFVSGFCIKNNRAVNIKQYKIPGKIAGIYTAKMDHRGRMLVATDGMGLAVFDTVAKTFSFFNASSPTPSQLTSSSTTAICEDHNGCIWVGTQKGLNEIEKDGVTVMQYSANEKKTSDRNKHRTILATDWWVTDIAEDKHGIIWFATLEHGIGRLDPKNDSISFFSTERGLPTCMFDELCIDDQDNLWATTKMGIVNLNVVTLQNKLCTEDEGFPSPDDINGIHYSKYNKKVYILTPYAFFEINAKDTMHNYNIPPTTITGFSVFGKERPFSATKDISLKYNENFINIEFAALLFHSNKQIKYAYKMEGVDENWVHCNYNRKASYTNLLPGHYIFSVKAQSPQGVWNEPTLLSVIIKPPYWQTWWFYILETLLAIAALLWITRLYTARKLAKQKIEIEKILAVSNERSRIASDLHDELGAGLTFIRMVSEIAGGKMKKDVNAEPEIEKIEKSATNLSENLREIIWTMNTQFDKLDDFIFYLRSYAVEYFDDSSIDFQFHAPCIVPEITLSGELRRNIFLCIKEALNNIIKHSGATEASLRFSITNNLLTTEIKDNGIGIKSAQTSKFGNGLNNMDKRLRKFGSNLEIDTDSGTKLLFKINIVSP